MLQFKASSHTLRSGRRRFQAPHDQMVALQKLCGSSRSVFYVLSLTGTTLELAVTPNLLSRTWFLDVAALPYSISPPTKRNGMPRKQGVHYIDVAPHLATIHSSPFDIRLIDAKALTEDLAKDDSRQMGLSIRDARQFAEIRKHFKRKAIAAILPP